MAGSLISIAAESVNIVYEEWLRDSFGLTTLILGSVAWVFSAAEVTGEGVVIGIADRFGKRALAMLTIGATGIIYLLMPLLGTNSLSAIVLLFLMFLFFEVSIVSMIPLATEALPQARGVMLTTFIACLSVSRALGTLLGGWMFRTVSIAMNGTVATFLSLVAAAILLRCVRKLR
jgi:DHA1 family purine base/nucleoside efflux pump-like MFS transporter